MSREDSFGFTHLEEEDDDDEAPYQSGSLNVDLQPHLSDSLTEQGAAQIEGIPNPTQSGQLSHLSGTDSPALSTDFGEGSRFNCSVSYERREVPNPDETMTRVCSGRESNAATVIESNNNIIVGDQIVSTNNNVPSVSVVSPSTVHIQYNNCEGKVNVMQGQVVTQPDGTRYIDTHGIPQTWAAAERPLRQRKIRFLKIFSIISCLFFFPSGIAGVYYAFQSEKEFNEGIMRGNIDRAQKLAKRSERYIVLSFVMSIIVAALIVAILERPYYASSVHGGTIVG